MTKHLAAFCRPHPETLDCPGVHHPAESMLATLSSTVVTHKSSACASTQIVFKFPLVDLCKSVQAQQFTLKSGRSIAINAIICRAVCG